MPYTDELKRAAVIKSLDAAIEAGDWNFAYTVAYAKRMLNRLAYKTIHELRKAVHDPNLIEEVAYVDSQLAQRKVSALDRQVARELAFAEFYARVGRYYEDKAIKKNGDVAEIKQLFAAIDKKYGGTNVDTSPDAKTSRVQEHEKKGTEAALQGGQALPSRSGK